MILDGSPISDYRHKLHKEQAREFGAEVAEMNRHLQAHIELLETAIKDSDDPKERERARAVIRRLQSGIERTVKSDQA